MTLTGIALRKSTTVMVLILFLFIAGLYSYVTLPREAAPDVKIPYMIVTAIYPGVAPSDIETLVTRPIEQELKTLTDVREITSSSSESVSMIAIEFEPDVNLDFALQKVKDKVDAAKSELPDDVEDPTVTEINFENMPIMNVSLTADYDLVKLKQVAEKLQDEFEAVPGVLGADITGGLEREVKIDVDPNRLKEYNLGFGDIIGTVQAEHITIPSGTMDIGDFTYSVRVPGELRDANLFGNLVVTATANGPVYLRDVATVTYGFKDPDTISRLDGRPSITLGVTKRAGENIIRISDRIKEIVEEQRSTFPAGTYVTFGSDQSKFIRIMVEDLENNIITGFLLVMLSIFLFLGITNAFFVAICIPLSMLITFIVLKAMGITLNFIVLFSLILALGMLVDNAIVIVENIFRHRQMLGKSAARGSLDGTNEVAIAVASSTLTTVAAFLPLMFWPGIMGEFMSYLPLTVIITLAASLFVALVINPVLCFRYMKVKSSDSDRFTGGGGLYARVVNRYERLLTRAVNHPKTTLLLSLAVLVATMALYGVIGRGVELFPIVDPDSVWINVKGPIGLKLDATDNIVRQLEETVKTFPDIQNVNSSVGISTSSNAISGGFSTSNEARIYMDFVDFEDRSQPSLQTFNESVNKIKYISGAEVELDMEDMGPPVGAPVEIRVSGDDYLTLGQLAREIRDTLGDVPGLVDLKDNFESSKPEIVFHVDREKAKILDVSTAEVATAVRTAINGIDAGDFRDGDDEYDITVRFPLRDRSSIPDLDLIYVMSSGKQIPLSSLGTFETAAGFGTINRIDLKRVVTISGNAYDRLSSAVLADVQAELADYPLPSGYALEYSGENADSEEAAAFLSKALVMALFLISIVLVSQFDSVVLPLIIMSSVILSLVGVFWGLMIAGLPFGIIMTGVGVISLAGVVVNNAIVLLDYTIKLRERGRDKMTAIVEAAKTRFRPVILTALTTILGLVPLATGWSFNFMEFKFVTSGSSSQWWVPMAVAVIFGLAFATVLTLVVVPSMYAILGRKEHDPYFDEHRIVEEEPETGI